jgi:DNA-binding CsgD family transcriptional regulator/DNA-binding MarR family transcriptional regulator
MALCCQQLATSVRPVTSAFAAAGLSAIEESIYRAVVHGGTTPGEIAEHLGLTHAQVSNAVDALTAQGLVLPAAADGRVVAVPPGVALEALLLREEEAIQARREALAKARVDAETLAKEFATGDAARARVDFLEVISGQDAINERFELIQRGARAEVVGLAKGPNRQGLNQPQLDRMAAGVRYRCIYELGALRDPGTRVPEYVAAGEDARVLSTVPIRMCIVDRRIALVPLKSTPQGEEGALMVHESALVDALVILFDTLWDRAEPISEFDPHPGSVDPSDTALLRLLAEGLKDQTIARHLGLAPRTLARRMASLLDSLGAKTRFQAGAAAARRGWIDDLDGGRGR